MKRLTVAVALLVCGACAGKVYEVHDGSTPLKGIPFYLLKGNCTQETVYQETLYRLLVQTPATKEIPSVLLLDKTIAESVYASTAMENLRKAIASKASLATIHELWKVLPAYIAKNPPDPKDVTLVSNIAKAGNYVDYAQVHYINVDRPGIGSASATATLNDNGTLAESSGEVEDRTAETILGMLPIGELLTGLIKDADIGALIMPAKPDEPFAVQLVATPQRFKHTLTKTVVGDAACPAREPISIGAADVNRRRDAVNEGGGADKGEEGAIAVTGKIVLPKKGGEE